MPCYGDAQRGLLATPAFVVTRVTMAPVFQQVGTSSGVTQTILSPSQAGLSAVTQSKEKLSCFPESSSKQF